MPAAGRTRALVLCQIRLAMLHQRCGEAEEAATERPPEVRYVA